MQDEKNAFVRTLCTISVTMASICFIGISVVLIIFYETKISGWVGVAYSGVLSVFSFTTASIFALVLLYPKLIKSKEEKELVLNLALLLFAFGWVVFFILIAALILAFSQVQLV